MLDISTLITATIAHMAMIAYTITTASISRQQKLMEYSLIAVVVSMRGVLQWQYQVSVTGQYYAFSVSDIDRYQPMMRSLFLLQMSATSLPQSPA